MSKKNFFIISVHKPKLRTFFKKVNCKTSSRKKRGKFDVKVKYLNKIFQIGKKKTNNTQRSDYCTPRVISILHSIQISPLQTKIEQWEKKYLKLEKAT